VTDQPPVLSSSRQRRWARAVDDAAGTLPPADAPLPELALDTAGAAPAGLGAAAASGLAAPPRPAPPASVGLANSPAPPLRQGASLPNPNTGGLAQGAGLANPNAGGVTQGAGLANPRVAPAPAPPPLPPPVPLNGIPAEPRQPPLLREHRVLLFHPTLLCQALHHAGRDRLRLPIEDVASAEMLTDSQSVRFRFGPGGRSGEVVVNTPGLGATLIAYCIGSGIPIPAHAAKSLQVTEHGVKLELRLTMTTPPYFRPRGSSEW
jgi:hypothetical protein